MSKVLESLHQLFPASREIKSAFYLTVDSVTKALDSAEIDFSIVRISNYHAIDWDDETLAEIVFGGHWLFHLGKMLIHSPACSRYSLPDFECRAEKLREFVDQYRVEMLFSGDIVFLAPESKTLTLFHDEGAFAHVQLGKGSMRRGHS